MKSIFVLTGAGISAESGIQTFRGSDGLWEGHRLEDVASPGGFQRDPSMVYRFFSRSSTNNSADPPPRWSPHEWTESCWRRDDRNGLARDHGYPHQRSHLSPGDCGIAIADPEVPLG